MSMARRIVGANGSIVRMTAYVLLTKARTLVNMNKSLGHGKYVSLGTRV
jgi:hypothetical protein